MCASLKTSARRWAGAPERSGGTMADDAIKPRELGTLGLAGFALCRGAIVTRSLAACITALLIAAGGSSGQQKTDPELNNLADAFAEAFSAKDAARVASFYADDAIVMPPDQGMVRGRRSIEAYYARGFRQDVSNFR